MFIVTETQKQQFKDICNNQYNGNIEYIIISLLNSRPDIIDVLLQNQTSFNFLLDNDTMVQTVPIGWQTNGGYKNSESVIINPNSKCVNFGLIIDSIRNVDGVMRFLKNMLASAGPSLNMRVVIGDTLQINYTSNVNSIIYKDVAQMAIVDVTFKYFRELFK